MEFLFFGKLYNCKKCGRPRGIINGKDYSQKAYQKMAEKYEKLWKCKETGRSLLSVSAEEEILCPKCKKGNQE